MWGSSSLNQPKGGTKPTEMDQARATKKTSEILSFLEEHKRKGISELGPQNQQEKGRHWKVTKKEKRTSRKRRPPPISLTNHPPTTQNTLTLYKLQ